MFGYMLVLKQQKLAIKILLLLPIIYFTFIIFLSILEPYLEYKMYPFAENIFKTLHYICHQAPSKSIWINNYTIAICARCFAIYAALLISGIIIYYKNYLKVKWSIGILLIIPILIDGLLQWFELRTGNKILSILTGSLAGVGLGLIFYPLYIKSILYLRTIFSEGG